MKFGIREVCNLTFNKKSGNGPSTFTIDTAKMTTLEGASTTVYAQGGRGNSRLMAWEGEKTLTFTVEDALITLESFYALTGAEIAAGSNSGIKFNIYPTSFAGYYSVTAQTLMRDEDGIDHIADISIPKAKLQTALNLSMAPTGDPSTFTFTFDAFPDADNSNLLFSLDIHGATGADSMTAPSGSLTGVKINGTVTTLANATKLAVTTAGAVTLSPASGTGTTITMPDSWKSGAYLTNMTDIVAHGTAKDFTLMSGVITEFFVID